MNYKKTFDRNSAEKQVVSNDLNFPEISGKIAALPTTVPCPSDKMTDLDIQYNLMNRLAMLAEKEWEAQRRTGLPCGDRQHLFSR